VIILKNILFVCTGNTCRSSMAKGIMEAAIAGDFQLANQYSVDSAGLSAFPNEPASPYSISVLKEEWDIDISSHKSKLLNQNIISKADIILTMTRSHRDAIINYYPELISKVFTLKEYISDINPEIAYEEYENTLDIVDPYGLPINMYRFCAKDIKMAVDRLILKLKTSFSD
jgi:protein-tyrosine phosphatase